MRRQIGILLGLAALLLAGCARDGIDLRNDASLYKPVNYEARFRRGGVVKVAVRKDLRPGYQRSGFTLWHTYTDERDMADPVPTLVEELVADELRLSNFFETVVIGTREYDWVLWLDVESFYGKWSSGRWNYLVPFKRQLVEGHVKLTATLLDRKNDAYIQETFDTRSEGTLPNYENGYPAAATELGKALRESIGKLLKWMDRG